MSVQSLFALAAQHAIAYRDAVDEAAPPRGYAAMREAFDAPTPEQGKAASEVIEELVALSTPGLRAMTGPRFFGWVIGASHPAGVAADWLNSAWGQNVGNHEASPAAAAAEGVAARWLLDLLDLPREASVGFVTGATVANFVCLTAARGAVLRRAGWDVEANGLFGAPPIHVLIGDDAHTSVFSALQFLGLGRDRVVRVATDGQGRMLPAAFTRAMAGANGPAIAIIQAGQINTGAFDPIQAILPERGHAEPGCMWMARLGCGRAPAPQPRTQLADSWAIDGHRWLQTPCDCGYAIVRDAEAHRRAMTISASYLPPAAAGDRDPTHFVPELSRRARGFATWAMIRHLGRAGIAASKGLQLRVVPCSSVIRSDRRLLARMLSNLLTNAVKYTDHGKVLVGCRHRGDTLRIEVWDNGIGIAADQLDAIFEEFYRVARSDTGRSGLGLGLY